MRLVNRIKDFFYRKPDPQRYYPSPKIMHVIGTHQAFRYWQQDQIAAAERGEEFYDPWRARWISGVQSLRGLSFGPDQVVRLHGYWQHPQVDEMERYLSLCFFLNEANRQDAA